VSKKIGALQRPTQIDIQKLKNKINEILDRRNRKNAVTDVIKAINPIVRGWTNYYQFVNSKETLNEVYFYLKNKFIKWYRGKYELNLVKGTIEALKWINQNDLHIYNMPAETVVRRYIPKRKSENPYIEGRIERGIENPFSDSKWFGQSDRDGDFRYECFNGAKFYI